MSWGSQRKTLIIVTLGSILFAIVAVTLIAVLYESPSCRDGKQNQDEAGIDCGGSCQYLCRASVQEPSIKFVRYLNPIPQRTDVIAYITNANATAAIDNARFTVSLYDDDGLLIARRDGEMDLSPATTVPLFVPEITSGYRAVARAFLVFDENSLNWYTDTEEKARIAVKNVVLTDGSTPRITANVENLSATPLYKVQVVVTVFDGKANPNAIAASSTVVDIPANGSSPVVFTWTTPFTDVPARVEVLPIQ